MRWPRTGHVAAFNARGRERFVADPGGRRGAPLFYGAQLLRGSSRAYPRLSSLADAGVGVARAIDDGRAQALEGRRNARADGSDEAIDISKGGNGDTAENGKG